ncbi:MAG: VOC family protein [Candidatus Dormibacteraeota bacterium]|nr:VOC family protein [Candidatus Dormibacteraeota bacterium]
MTIKRLDHIGVLVDDLAEAQRFLSGSLGLELDRTVAGGSRRGAFYRCGEVEIEVLEDSDADARDRVLAGSKARIEHIAVEVDDLDQTLAALQGLGVKAARGPITTGDRVNLWTDPETCDGVMYQLVEKR